MLYDFVVQIFHDFYVLLGESLFVFAQLFCFLFEANRLQLLIADCVDADDGQNNTARALELLLDRLQLVLEGFVLLKQFEAMLRKFGSFLAASFMNVVGVADELKVQLRVGQQVESVGVDVGGEQFFQFLLILQLVTHT